jgi:hypothetical protein
MIISTNCKNVGQNFLPFKRKNSDCSDDSDNGSNYSQNTSSPVPNQSDIDALNTTYFTEANRIVGQKDGNLIYLYTHAHL